MRFFRLDDEHPLTGWHMLAIVCLFFGTVIAVKHGVGLRRDRHVPRAGRGEQLRGEPAL